MASAARRPSPLLKTTVPNMAGAAPPLLLTTPPLIWQAQHVAPLVDAVRHRILSPARRASDATAGAAGAPRGWRAASSLHAVGGSDTEPVAASL
eukprot:4245175-Prymnesium_polylepis.1